MAERKYQPDLVRDYANLQQLMMNLSYLLSRHDINLEYRKRLQNLLRAVDLESKKVALVVDAEAEQCAA